MGRWAPDAQERIQRAALSLFAEHGYEGVTVADVAARAGLTKRTFFNHFVDKREVLFAGAAALEIEVISRLRSTQVTEEPLKAVLEALVGVGETLRGALEFVRLRRALIASSHDLQERELLKNAALARVIAGELSRWELSSRGAHLVATLAVAVFATSFDEWADDPDVDFARVVENASVEMGRIFAPASSNLRPHPEGNHSGSL